MAYLIYFGAAVAEIAGCFAFWAWLRLGRSIGWLAPGLVSLAIFAYLLTLVDAAHAGRAYAAYGGVYILCAIGWLWIAERAVPDRWDVLGAAICLAGSAGHIMGTSHRVSGTMLRRVNTPALLARSPIHADGIPASPGLRPVFPAPQHFACRTNARPP